MCSGTASLAPEVRVELLVLLAADSDEVVAPRAAGALLSQPTEAFVAALAREDATLALFGYCAKNLADKPGVADALAKNPRCPAELLIPGALHLTTAAVQMLMEDLERLSSAQGLAAALAKSSSLTAEQRHYLLELQQDSSDEAALAEAVAAAEPDLAKRQTLLQKLARMNVVERVQLAWRGNREERMTLIRDPNRVVQRAVLQSGRLTILEVEEFAAMTNLSEEVLRQIAMSRKFRKNYTVIRNLLNNSKTPLDISLHLLPSVNAQDLKLLTTNKNIPETLRTMALRLQRQRGKTREHS